MLEKRHRMARWLSGDGIEIGALHQPLEVPPGVHVTYVDHLPVESLREHYPELEDRDLAPVEVIGNAEDLSAFADGSLDFVVANHLFEHLEYPIQGLLEFQRVLRPGGVLYLALPDKRATFDKTRDVTAVDHLIAEQQEGLAEQNRRAHYLDWAEHVDGKVPASATEEHADALMAIPYSIHFHVWRPDTFLDFLAAARREFPVTLQPVQFAGLEGPDDFEFIILLAKPDGDKPVLPTHPDNGEIRVEDLRRELAEVTAERDLQRLIIDARSVRLARWLAATTRRAVRRPARPPAEEPAAEATHQS